MKNKVRLTENQLIKVIERILEQSTDYSSDIDRPTSDREKDIKSLFGDKYSKYIPNDVIRYLRKNPSTVFEKLYKIYGEESYTYLDKAKNKSNK
jgi:hypothetical protein